MDLSFQWPERASSELHFRRVIKSGWGITISSWGSWLHCLITPPAAAGWNSYHPGPLATSAGLAGPCQTVTQGSDDQIQPLFHSEGSLWVKGGPVSALEWTFAVGLTFTIYSPDPNSTMPWSVCHNVSFPGGEPWVASLIHTSQPLTRLPNEHPAKSHELNIHHTYGWSHLFR